MWFLHRITITYYVFKLAAVPKILINLVRNDSSIAQKLILYSGLYVISQIDFMFIRRKSGLK